MRCPTCGSSEVYRSRRRFFERYFNWLIRYQQRPYRCATCMARFWIRLETHIWRHTVRLRILKVVRAWGLYVGALLIVVVIAWSMNYINQKTLQKNLLLETAVDQAMSKQLDKSDLSEEQKRQAREFLNQNKDLLLDRFKDSEVTEEDLRKLLDKEEF